MITPAFTDLTGIAGLTLALAATTVAIPGVRRLPRLRLALLLAAVAVLVLAPIGTLPLAAYLRGATGDLSITTVVMLCCVVFRALTGRPALEQNMRFALPAFISIAALALYPMALGVGLFDPYRLGYGSPWFVGALFAAALASWFGRLPVIAACLALGTLAWSVHWYESTNLWDYVLDPLVSFYALGATAVSGVNGIVRSLRSPRNRAAPAHAAAQS